VKWVQCASLPSVYKHFSLKFDQWTWKYWEQKHFLSNSYWKSKHCLLNPENTSTCAWILIGGLGNTGNRSASHWILISGLLIEFSSSNLDILRTKAPVTHCSTPESLQHANHCNTSATHCNTAPVTKAPVIKVSSVDLDILGTEVLLIGFSS